jgi:hypothetical protein
MTYFEKLITIIHTFVYCMLSVSLFANVLFYTGKIDVEQRHELTAALTEANSFNQIDKQKGKK